MSGAATGAAGRHAGGEGAAAVVRVVVPYHLRNLAGIDGEALLEVAPPVTVRSALDALEARYPVLVGTIRDSASGVRRPMIRFFACRTDFSHGGPDAALPEAVARGEEPLLVVGAISGG